MGYISESKQGVIAVLGGVLRKNKDGSWRTSNLRENGESHGSLGDSLRVETAALLYRKNPKYLVIASGGRGCFKDIVGIPTIARVIKSELVRLRVPARAIVVEEKSGTTHEQLQQIKKILFKHFVPNLIIVSNVWHLPRVKVLAKLDTVLNNMIKQRRLMFKSAEKILIKQDPRRWKKKIEEAYKQDEMRRIIQLEKKGIKNLLEGKYIFRITL